jgi:hypothetical protein
VAKANNHKPVKRQRKAEVASTRESAKELTERLAAEWAKSNPALVEQIRRAGEYLKKLPAPPSEVEHADRAERGAARKEALGEMLRYVNQTSSSGAERLLQELPSRAEAPRPKSTPVVQNKTLTWITAQYDLMKAVGKSPPRVKKADIACELHERLKKAARADESLRPWKSRTIENRMRDHKLW